MSNEYRGSEELTGLSNEYRGSKELAGLSNLYRGSEELTGSKMGEVVVLLRCGGPWKMWVGFQINNEYHGYYDQTVPTFDNYFK